MLVAACGAGLWYNMPSTALMTNNCVVNGIGKPTNTKQIQRDSLEDYFLPAIKQKKIFRVNSERKPYSVNPYPKLKSGKTIYFLMYSYGCTEK